MCKDCFLTIANEAREMSEMAKGNGHTEMEEGMADIALLAFVSTELKSSKMHNCMLSLLTLVFAEPSMFNAVLKTIEFAISKVDGLEATYVCDKEG